MPLVRGSQSEKLTCSTLMREMESNKRVGRQNKRPRAPQHSSQQLSFAAIKNTNREQINHYLALEAYKN